MKTFPKLIKYANFTKVVNEITYTIRKYDRKFNSLDFADDIMLWGVR